MISDDDYNVFFSMVDHLLLNGFELKLEYKNDNDGSEWYTASSICSEKQRVRFSFCSPSTHVYSCLSGKISADNSDCFDKWSKAPLQIDLPKTDKEYKMTLTYIYWLGTEEGYEASNSFNTKYFVQTYEQLEALIKVDGDVC